MSTSTARTLQLLSMIGLIMCLFGLKHYWHGWAAASGGLFCAILGAMWWHLDDIRFGRLRK